MKIRMIVPISGGRGDGTPWPPPGVAFEVGDEEGAHLCAGRLAVPVVDDKVETPAPADADVEVRAARKPRQAAAKK